MPIARSYRRKNVPRPRLRHWARRRLAVEWLEDRTLLSSATLATAVPLSFTAFHTAQAAHVLASPSEVDLYRLRLGAGDQLSAAVDTQANGGGGALKSLLRIFAADGTPLALDDQEGGDPRLTFQAQAAGTYYVGVSSAPNDAYDPATGSGGAGATTGLYTLNLRMTAGVPLTPDLAGSSFRLTTATAAYGDTVSGTFAVDNRGGAAAGPFGVQVVVSPDNLFGPQSVVLETFPLAGLGAGRAFSPGGFTVTLPDRATATAAGLPASGPVYLGLRIDPAGAVPELNRYDQSGVHRGADWERLTVVTPVTASGRNLSLASADVLANLNSRVKGCSKRGCLRIIDFIGNKVFVRF